MRGKQTFNRISKVYTLSWHTVLILQIATLSQGDPQVHKCSLPHDSIKTLEIVLSLGRSSDNLAQEVAYILGVDPFICASPHVEMEHDLDSSPTY